jgi:ubiquitin-activating enzyme E1
LDNIQARNYIDSKCVIYGKPLFESGTLGTKANDVIVLPKLTPSYSEGPAPGETGGIKKCTLRNFPSLVLHCIEWAREMFDDWFTQGPDLASSFVKDKNAFFEKQAANAMEELPSLRLVKKWADLGTNPSVDKCATFMINVFLKFFRDGIKDLIHHFPADARNTHKETGADLGLFWHGHKRFPQIAEWDPNNETFTNFVFHSTNILVNQVFELKTNVDEASIKKLCQAFKASDWVFSGGEIELEEDEKDGGEEKKQVDLDDAEVKELAKLKEELNALDIKTIAQMKPADFEKDDEKNHHIDIITSSTNLRAWNYRIKETTAAHCRMIAGKIIPAIATTTA